jgi:hypothetical protein
MCHQSVGIVLDDLLIGLDGVEDTEKYIDDTGIFSPDWRRHLAVIDRVCKALNDNGYTVNPLKCECAVMESDFLGHWFTPDGVKATREKIDAIDAMQPPTNLKTISHFGTLDGFARYKGFPMGT